MGVPRRTIKSSVGAGSVSRERVRQVMISLKQQGGIASAEAARGGWLINQVAEKAEIPPERAEKAVEVLFARDGIIVEALRKGESVSITGFGSFHTGGGSRRSALETGVGMDDVFHPDQSLTQVFES
jgi:hypothetical protein